MSRKNDEALLAALLSAGSVRRAAELAGVGVTTMRNRLADPDFKKRYEAEKAALLSETCNCIVARLMSATDVLAGIMTDTGNPSTVRCSAADALLRHGLRYLEAGNILARLDALEALNDTKN